MPNPAKMNLNYLLNVAYYDELSHRHFDECNRELTKRCFEQCAEKIPLIQNAFALKTIYPGLLIGIGNTHEAGTDIEGTDEEGAEIKMGFTLDYVTGLPIIPGSTVKGVLRSAFKNRHKYDIDLLETRIADIESEIFDQGKVVFYDAVPIKAGKKQCLFALENNTPHKAKDPAYDGLVSPTPLTLLKVIPNVVFMFRFGFERWDDENVTVDNLQETFKTILTVNGIGAKTNVGFGAIEELPDGEQISANWLVAGDSTAHTPQTQPA